jgi:sugar/nucleoside kinase (ribokinase family)
MKKIVGMGNALVDVLMQLDNDTLLETLSIPRGSMQLIDEARMLQIREATENYQRHISAGGSASNTMYGLAQLGVECGLIGKVSQDEMGLFFRQDLMKEGVKPHLLYSERSTGVCHVLISPDGERTMNTYLGAAIELSPEDLSPEMFEGYDLLHIEGYLVQNEALMTRAGELAKEMGLEISIDLASYNVIEESHAFLCDFVKKYVNIVFANEEEAFAFTKRIDVDAVEAISQLADIAVVKVGARGSYVKVGQTIEHVGARPIKNILDTTGAGDSFASGFLSQYARGGDLVECAEKGTFCAGCVIQVVGARTEF